jgi:hypothetical protein
MATWDDLRKQETTKRVMDKHGTVPPAERREQEVHGAMRHHLHEGSASHRPLSTGYEQVGIAGEQAFAREFGIEWDRELRPGGNGGSNFRYRGKRVNVYTARKPLNLIVEKGKATADIYVLAGYRDGSARLIGWATKRMVLDAPVKDVGGFGIMSHAIPFEDLFAMSELDKALAPEPVQETLL